MRVSLHAKLDIRVLRHWFSRPLEQWLGIAGWVILGITLLFLVADAAVFVLYGLGRAGIPESETSPPLRLEEDLIRGAAAALEARQAEFSRPPSAPADLENPFR